MDKLRGLWHGKSAEFGNWIEGYFAGYFLNNSKELAPHILRTDNGDLEEVISETLGECIGKRDKNRDHIFEGDIIKFKEWGRGAWCWIGKVCYEYQQFVVSGNPNSECSTPFTIPMSRFSPEWVEVIGNIHDDPQLLMN